MEKSNVLPFVNLNLKNPKDPTISKKMATVSELSDRILKSDIASNEKLQQLDDLICTLIDNIIDI
jgi:hypothetical protein